MDTTDRSLPVIRQALGEEQWQRLDPVVRRHYDLPPGTPGELVCRGIMQEIFHSRRAAPLLRMGRLIGTLVSRQGRDIPVEVRNSTYSGSPAMHWHRTFRFPGREPEVFVSRMEYLQGDQIVEYVRHGLGICMALSVEDGALVYRSRGYRWGPPSLPLRIPDRLLLGEARIIERGLSEREFEIAFEVVHPLWGRSFGYSGTFYIGADDEHGNRAPNPP